MRNVCKSDLRYANQQALEYCIFYKLWSSYNSIIPLRFFLRWLMCLQ